MHSSAPTASLLHAGYNLEGEEVLAVSAENTEGEGLLVETPPEPEPEPEQEGGEEGGWPLLRPSALRGLDPA